MKNALMIAGLTLMLAACDDTSPIERDPDAPVEIVDCEPDDACQ